MCCFVGGEGEIRLIAQRASSLAKAERQHRKAVRHAKRVAV